MKLSKELSARIAKIETELNHLLDNKEHEIMDCIRFDIIYDFYTAEKYEITHEWDPPYDHSGSLINKYKHFNVDDYDTIGDFLAEYTGESRATYVSRYGLYYVDFENYYADAIEERLLDVMWKYISSIDIDTFEMMVAEAGWQKEYDKVKEKKDDYQIQDIYIEIADYYEFMRNAIDRVVKIMEEIKKSNFKYWHDLLGDNVRKKVTEDKELARKKYEQDQLRIKKEKQEFSIIWERLEKSYFIDYQEEIPKRIEAPQFSKFLKFLKQNNIKGYEFEMIANYAPVSFSNSVIGKLKCVALDENSIELNKVNNKIRSASMGK